MDKTPTRRSRSRNRGRRLEAFSRSERRTETPRRRECDTPTRSRSQRHTRSPSRSQLRAISSACCQSDQELKSSQERVKRLEREFLRRRILAEGGHHRASARLLTEPRDRSRSRLSGEQTPSNSRQRAAEAPGGHRAERRDDAGQFERSRSLSISKRDLVDIIHSLRDGVLASQPFTQVTPAPRIDHKNILPEFDPSNKNQRIDIWLRKINECASVYGWDDKTTIHFAMPKLQGLAKTWYESLDSILFTWQEWQSKLISAFPHEQNYGQMLEDMLKRRSRFNESIENYYYEKLSLLNQCNITGKRAAECIIHGISDRTLKSGALALRCSHPDQLLQYLISSKISYHNIADRIPFKKNNTEHFNNNNPTNKSGGRFGQPIGCYNCKERGHSFLHCPKPLIKCTRCFLVGHTADKCDNKTENKTGNTNTVQKTMCIDSMDKRIVYHPNSKFFKEVRVYDTPMQAFVDFGSEITLIKESAVRELGLTHDNAPSMMKGFGNGIVQSLGELSLKITVDGVCAKVVSKVVDDKLLEKSLLIGQSYTEQPHIIVYKDVANLQFLNLFNEMPSVDQDITSESPLKIQTAGSIELYGAATVRAQTDPLFSGYVLLKSNIAGKPNEQLFVCGGLYQANNGHINVAVIPCLSYCRMAANSVFCRAERVDLVNRVIVEPPEIPVTIKGDLDESKIQVGTQISDAERRSLIELLKKYKHCFATSLKELGCTNAAEMCIELNSQRPIVYRPYRLSHHERDVVRAMVKDMLDAGIVRESVSEYASPILLVRKKNGSFRMCIDYRKLNSVTVKERYPMPIIEDEIARLTDQACFISLDLASGYYQVPIAEQSKHLTSFVTPDGQYEFNRMPFGLANAPAVFQRMMNSILGSARFNSATAYIDDVLIFGKNPAECLERLEQVLQLMEKANLTLNLPKCNFLRDRINYLGYEISVSGVRPGEEKIISVMNFPRPENVHNVRQFLGLASYFRKFIKDFAQIAFPLSKLLKKNTIWEWNNNQEEAFGRLKAMLIDRPVLAIYDPAAEIELHTDASKIGIGGILLQRSSASDIFRPVAYYSRQTSPEEKNFHSYELETLAVVCSLRKFRVYLLGKEFKIITDCSALRSTFSKRDLIPRIARWWLLLQEFDCSIEYKAGAKMGHVDALSRNPIIEPNEADQFSVVMSINDEDWLHTLQLGDAELRRIRDVLCSGLDEKGLQYITENYVMKDNKLYRYIGGDKNDIRWVVPKGARWQICRMNHDDIGHFGVEKTLERIKNSYWFAKMSKFVKKYVSACIECAYAKNHSNAREGLLHPIAKVEVPFHTLHVDHLGPFVKSKRGHTHLFVVVDAFTKFCFIKPVRNTNTQNVIKALEDIFYTFRVPDRIISDRGSCFTSHTFKNFCKDKGVKHVLNTVASPRSNGQVERYNRTILDSLKTLNLKRDERDWDNQLGKIQWGLNNTFQKTTHRKPSEVLFGTCMNSEINPILNKIIEETRGMNDFYTIRTEVKDRTDSEQVKQKQRYDKGRKPARKYSEGDLVKITKTCFKNDGKSKKLMPSYLGPYRVTKDLGKDRYTVAPVPGLTCTQNKRPTTVAADRMMPWIHIDALEVNELDSDTSITGFTDDD